jgi:hypothetical protein
VRQKKPKKSSAALKGEAKEMPEKKLMLVPYSTYQHGVSSEPKLKVPVQLATCSWLV